MPLIKHPFFISGELFLIERLTNERISLKNFTGAMKKRFFICVLLCCVIAGGCVSSLQEAKRLKAVVPLSGEKIFIYPIIDSSSLDKFEGWPSEKPYQTLLQRNFLQMYRTMIVEFRRNEKYGLYEIVEDSTQSSTQLSFIVQRYSFKKDTLTLPVRMTIRQGTVKNAFPSVFIAYGIYKAHSRPKSPFHYIDILLADFCRNFPYKQVVGIFCPQQGNK